MGCVRDKHSARVLSPRMFFIILLSVMTAFAALGLKIGGGDAVSFYGRYDEALPSDVIPVIREVLLHVLPELILIISMLLSSFSPFLVPLSLAAVSVRGFLCGAAAGIMGVSAEAAVYASGTVAVCIFAALLRYFCRKTNDMTNVFRRIYLTFCTAGFCVLIEALLLFI